MKKQRKVVPKLPDVVWERIHTEYVTSNISYKSIADKYGTSFYAVQKKALAEGWADERKDFLASVHDKSLEKVMENKVESVSRAIRIGFTLLEKVEKAVDELDKTQLITTTTCKELLPNGIEKLTEEQDIKIVTGLVDRRGLKEVTDAFKRLAEIGIFKSELDRREQEARIAKLERDAAEQDRETNIVVTFAEEVMDEYAE